MRTWLVLLALPAALLSGCLVEDASGDAADPAPGGVADASPAPAPAPAAEASEDAPDQPHGQPQVAEGPVSSGIDPARVPPAWAQRTVTVTNDVNGARLAEVLAEVSIGSLVVRTAEREGYLVEAVLTAEGASEADAVAMLKRARLDHEDALAAGVLRLGDEVAVEDGPSPLPMPAGIHVGTDMSTVRVALTITLPLGLPASLEARTSSADATVQGLAGPQLRVHTSSGDATAAGLRMGEAAISTSSGSIAVDGLSARALELDTSSGDVTAAGLAVQALTAHSSSGDLVLEGAIDGLDASTSSGEVAVDAAPAASGAYELASSSGDVTLTLAADGRAYRVTAATSSGEVSVDVPGAEAAEGDDGKVTAESPGYDGAGLRTAVDVATSSGDIAVTAA